VSTVVGLDLSLRNTGLARITWASQALAVDTWRRGEAGITTMPDPTDRCRALVHIRADVLEWTEPCDLVVIESMVPNPKSRSTNERGALWYMVLQRLLDHERRVMFVHPNTLKRYATGSGGADKPAVRAAARVAFPGVRTTCADEDDALWLAGIGTHLLDGPVPYEITDYRAAVVASLSLPAEEAA
jgi:Holliday junction resolvasome RuvABC endonuclease subunit